MKKLGIVGGLGTETSCEALINISNAFRKRTGRQAEIVLVNVPLSTNLLRKTIDGWSEQMSKILKAAVITLNKAKVDFIIIPCNTVHVVINDLRKISKVPIISIIEETGKFCKNLKTIGLLASSSTIKNKLHHKELNKYKIKVIVPSKKEQQAIDKIIYRLDSNQVKKNDKEILLKIIENLKVGSIILGCTDFRVLVKESKKKLIETTAILEKAALRELSR